MKKLTTALLCLLMVFSCAFCINAEDATEVSEETPVEVQEAETKVAKIGNVEYATLQEAIDAAKNGEEVVLLQNAKEHVRVSETSNVVLNLNGKTIDNDDNDASTIENLGTLTVKGEGKVLNTTSGNFVLYNRATVVIDGPDFIASKHSGSDFTGIVINEYKATINSGTFTADSNEVETIITSAAADSNMTINGGVFGNGKLNFYQSKDNDNCFVLNGGTYFTEEGRMYGIKKYIPEGYAFFKNEDGSFSIKYNKVKLSAYQDDAGNLIIKGSEDLIESLYNGRLSTYESNAITGSYLEMTVVGPGWRGTLWNQTNKYEDGEVHEEKYIEMVDKTTLKVSKQALVDKGFADGKYEFVINSFDGKDSKEQPFECDPVQITTGIKYQPNQQKVLKLVGEVPQPVAGKATIVDKTKFSLIGEDGKPVDPSSYDLNWYDKHDEKNYFQTSDSVFKTGKEYRLAVKYRYIFDRANDIKSSDIKFSCSDTKTSWSNIDVFAPYGVAGGVGIWTTDWTVFLQNESLVPTEGEVVAKNGTKEYVSIQEAIDSAQNGDEIVLVNDAAEDIYVPDGKKIVLNISNHSIKNVDKFAIYNIGDLTIKGTGTIYDNESPSYGSFYVCLYNQGKLVINGPSFKWGDNKPSERTNMISNSGDLTIEGNSKFDGGISNSDVLTVNGGEFQSYINNHKDLTINYGTFNNSDEAWIVSYEGKTVINGGKFINSSEGLKVVDGTFEIKGGIFIGALDNLSHYLADGYCLSENANGETVVVKATQATVKEPTVVGNQDNLDIVKKTEEFKDVQSVAINANVKKQLTPNEVKKIEAIVENNKEDVSYKIPLDLKLTAIKNDGIETNITKVDKEITITLALSDENVKALKDAKVIKVARFHGDEVTLLDAKLEGNILTFKTDRFSTYVVVGYRQAGGATPTPSPTPTTKPIVSNTSKAGPKDLNTDGVITCDEEMGSTNWIWSESKKACVYKVSNTSVK